MWFDCRTCLGTKVSRSGTRVKGDDHVLICCTCYQQRLSMTLTLVVMFLVTIMLRKNVPSWGKALIAEDTLKLTWRLTQASCHRAWALWTWNLTDIMCIRVVWRRRSVMSKQMCQKTRREPQQEEDQSWCYSLSNDPLVCLLHFQLQVVVSLLKWNMQTEGRLLSGPHLLHSFCGCCGFLCVDWHICFEHNAPSSLNRKHTRYVSNVSLRPNIATWSPSCISSAFWSGIFNKDLSPTREVYPQNKNLTVETLLFACTTH